MPAWQGGSATEVFTVEIVVIPRKAGNTNTFFESGATRSNCATARKGKQLGMMGANAGNVEVLILF